MTGEYEKLRLGRNAPFPKSTLKRLRQEEETWEADFRALPKPWEQRQTHYLGLVVGPRRTVLAQSHVEGRPEVNDMAVLLARAMRRPPAGRGHRPRRLRVRGHPQWRELFPHLAHLGITVSVRRDLSGIQAAYAAHMGQLREQHRIGMVRPTAEQQAVERLFPALALYVRGYGRLEIGEDEMEGFVARALGHGGLSFEDDRSDTLAEALAGLEHGLRQWFEEQGVTVEGDGPVPIR